LGDLEGYCRIKKEHALACRIMQDHAGFNYYIKQVEKSKSIVYTD
jgi:hypothetical protein